MCGLQRERGREREYVWTAESAQARIRASARAYTHESVRVQSECVKAYIPQVALRRSQQVVRWRERARTRVCLRECACARARMDLCVCRERVREAHGVSRVCRERVAQVSGTA